MSDDDTVGYIGVSNGKPIFAKTGDDRGDSVELAIFQKSEHALARFHNVRRVRLVIDADPVRAPEVWGSIDE